MPFLKSMTRPPDFKTGEHDCFHIGIYQSKSPVYENIVAPRRLDFSKPIERIHVECTHQKQSKLHIERRKFAGSGTLPDFLYCFRPYRSGSAVVKQRKKRIPRGNGAYPIHHHCERTILCRRFEKSLTFPLQINKKRRPFLKTCAHTMNPSRYRWSGRQDSNLRPPGPKPGALPS